MKKNSPALLIMIIAFFASCDKEYSLENGNLVDESIVGVDCRINKIIYTDTAGVDINLGAMQANISNQDIVTEIRKYDSLSSILEFIVMPTYINDTVYINPDEYFIVDVNKRITKLHALEDPTDPFSQQLDVFYQYNAGGFLVAKNYFFTLTPTIPVYRVDYIYNGGNLTNMTKTNLLTGDLELDAVLNYYNNVIPRRYIYLFPDENDYSHFNQFYNFGAKSYNAVKDIKVRNYDPGNVVRDSLVSTFSNYVMSRDTYVLSVQMAGADQPSIPAPAGKLTFKYKCK